VSNEGRRLLSHVLPVFLVLLAFSILAMTAPPLTFAASKKAKPEAKPVQKEKDIVINDGNLKAYQKKVEDFVKKGDFDNSLSIMLRIHDYADDVLSTLKAVKAQYEKAVGDQSLPQKDKEDLFIKLTRIGELMPRYATLYNSSTFNLGYLYAKRGETEKARKCLVEFMQTAPFSTGRDSQWMKAKALLLELYGLEGEF